MRGRGRTEPQHRWLYLAVALSFRFMAVTGGALWLVAMRLVLASLWAWRAVSAIRAVETSPLRYLNRVFPRPPSDDRSRAWLTFALVVWTIALLPLVL
jgi:hypothetical protein